jgi:hypothetical protein
LYNLFLPVTVAEILAALLLPVSAEYGLDLPLSACLIFSLTSGLNEAFRSPVAGFFLDLI